MSWGEVERGEEDQERRGRPGKERKTSTMGELDPLLAIGASPRPQEPMGDPGPSLLLLVLVRPGSPVLQEEWGAGQARE